MHFTLLRQNTIANGGKRKTLLRLCGRKVFSCFKDKTPPFWRRRSPIIVRAPSFSLAHHPRQYNMSFGSMRVVTPTNPSEVKVKRGGEFRTWRRGPCRRSFAGPVLDQNGIELQIRGTTQAHMVFSSTTFFFIVFLGVFFVLQLSRGVS